MKRIAALFLICMFLLVSTGIKASHALAFSCNLVTDVPVAECQALAAIYNSAGGMNWGQRANWLTSTTVGTWQRVTVSAGHVTKLDLGSNSLYGTIPPEIGNLTEVTELSLGSNQLSGTIPASIGNLTQLLQLNLMGNGLTGSIPPEIGNLIHIWYLNLASNQLSGGIPAQIASLNALWYLHLSGNQLSGSIPTWFGGMTGLRILDLSRNTLTGSIPPELGSMSSVYSLRLGSNLLSGTIPTSLSTLSGLIDLELENNALTGELPYQLGNLSGLQYLFLHNNQLSSSIPVEFGNPTGLKELRLHNNNLFGDIPTSLANLIHLEAPGTAWDGGDGLTLDGNRLNLPAGYPNSTVPFQAFLYSKDPNWHITQQFTACANIFGITPGECTALQALFNSTNGAGWADHTRWLQDNNPAGWFGVTVEDGHVKLLLLPANNLSGSLPAELGNLTWLKQLHLSSNPLTGSIPPQMGNLTGMEYWVIDHTQLSGEIPTQLGNLGNVIYFSLMNNQHTGNIPQQLGNLTNVRYLYLNNNQFTGFIPWTLGNLTNLNFLRLENNQLSGDVPFELQNLVNVVDLFGINMDYNRLNVPIGYPIPGNALHAFLFQKDLNWEHRQGFHKVIPDTGGIVASWDNAVQVVVQPGAYSQYATFNYMPQFNPGYSTGSLAFTQTSFHLSALDYLGNPLTTFSPPLQVTIHYDDQPGLPETALGLYYWDNGAQTFMDAVTTCGASAQYTRDFVNNTFSLSLCHLSEFAVLSNAKHIYLPVTWQR